MGRQASQINAGNEVSSPCVGHGTTSKKRSKLSKKSLEDCNGVHHASVPRKLRSAMMKKRNRRSGGISSKKPNHAKTGADSTQNIGNREAAWGPITKDEAEVVGTLYALSRMFTNSETTGSNKFHTSSLEANTSSSPEEKSRHIATIEVLKEDLNSVAEAVKTNNSSRVPSVREQTLFDDSQKVESHACTAEVRSDVSQHSFAVRKENNEKSWFSLVSLDVQAELSQDSRLKQISADEAENKAEIEFRVTDIRSQSAQQCGLEEYKKNGLALWPGLYSTASQCATYHIHSDSSAVKTPGWMDASPIYAPQTSALEVETLNVDRVSMKRSATHVSITRLIHAFKMSDKHGLVPLFNQPRTATVNCLARLRESSNVIVSGVSTVTSASRDPYEVRNDIIHEDHLQVGFPCGTYSPQRQSFDFMSISDRVVRSEADATHAAKNRLASPSQLQLPHLRSRPQYDHIKPFSVSQNCFKSAAASQIQLYPSCQFPGNHQMSHAAFNKQQQLWMTQMSSQHRPNGSSFLSSQHPRWKHVKREISTSPIPFHQYASLMTQHHPQQYMVTGSSSAKRQHNLPLVLPPEENGARFYANGALPMQLLCHERI